MIRRKMGAVRPEHPGADRVWPRALVRAAREILGLEMTVTGVSHATGLVEDLRKDIPDGPLVLPLLRAGGASGAVVLTGDLFQAVVEWQLSQRIVAGGASRIPTRTDAMLTQPWMDHAIALMVDMLAEDEDLATISDLATTLGGGDLFALAGEYRQIGVTVQVGGGARSGSVLLLVPRQTAMTESSVRDRQFGTDFRQQVMATEASMQAVLCRMTFPLATVMALREGLSLPLAGASVQDMAIEGADGVAIAKGRLGQHRGMRAVRVVFDEAGLPQTTIVALREAS